MTVLHALLQAATRLSSPFTEWDLTVEAHKIAPKLVSMPGYPQYPDHKRVYCELIKAKYHILRVKRNQYKLSDEGLAYLALLTHPSELTEIYDRFVRHLHTPGYRMWKANPAQPTLSITAREALCGYTLPEAQRYVEESLTLMREKGTATLYGHKSNNRGPIAYQDVASYGDFLTAMEERFRWRA